MSLSERIREAISASGKSQAEIAREIGISTGAVTLLLNGTSKSLKAVTAIALEAATGHRATWIVTGKGPKLLTPPIAITNEISIGAAIHIVPRLDVAASMGNGHFAPESEVVLDSLPISRDGIPTFPSTVVKLSALKKWCLGCLHLKA